MGIDPVMWNRKRVLVTGHTGFKGSWLTLLLKELGAEVIGLSLPPEKPQSLYVDSKIHELLAAEYFQDIRDEVGVERAIRSANVDYVFHLAAQAFVRRSVRNPIESITTNVCGTANVLISLLASNSVLGATIVMTDKVYQNLGGNKPFKESDRLGGHDPYSASKVAAEFIVASLISSNNPRKIPVTTVRAGNVIGGGDWGEERLVPDLVRSLNSNSTLSIRKPNATRPWQHVLDCLYGYLLVAQAHLEKNDKVPRSFNFGPSQSLSVVELVRLFEIAFNKRVVYEFAESAIPEKDWLELDSGLARDYLGWQTSFSPSMAVTQTADWYSKFGSGADAQELMRDNISKYRIGKW